MYEHDHDTIPLPAWKERLDERARDGWEYLDQQPIGVGQFKGSVLNAQGQTNTFPVMLVFYRRAIKPEQIKPEQIEPPKLAA